jgi:hypothetical protein
MSPTEPEGWRLPGRCPICGADLKLIECRFAAIRRGKYRCGSVQIEDGYRRRIVCSEACPARPTPQPDEIPV